MRFIKILLLLCFVSEIASCQDLNVSDVFFEGDCTDMGMNVTSCYINDKAFLVETTGARFEYTDGEIKVYQGLAQASRRLLASIKIYKAPKFTKVQSTDDHVLFWSETINLGIYGDSTLIISPKIMQPLNCTGNFKPNYQGRHKGEILLIDDKGGMEIYPQRYEAGYKIRRLDLDKQDWVANYILNKNERVMIAAFPARPFNWEESFRSNVISTNGFPNGQLPDNKTLSIWSEHFDIITLFYKGIYKSQKPYGPYYLSNEEKFTRFLSDAKFNNLKVLAFTSPFYYKRYHKNFNGYWEQVNKLKKQYSIKGFYIDGLLFDDNKYQIDDKIKNYEIIRRLRKLVGEDGVLMYHGSSFGDPVGTIPNVDAYCNITLNGENVPFSSLDDDFINYNIRKYGISNTVAMWKPGPHPKNITRHQIIDKIIQMNARERMWGYPLKRKSAYGIKYSWPRKFNSEYGYYIKKIKKVENTYRSKVEK